MSSRVVAVMLLLTAHSGCRSVPWSKEAPNEVNIAVSLRANLLTAEQTVNGRRATVLFGSAQSRSVIDPRFAALRPSTATTVELGNRKSLKLHPVTLALEGVADILLASDAWAGSVVHFDYSKRLVTVGTSLRSRDDLKNHPFESAPSIPIVVNGEPMIAIVDTASPDTLVVPSRNGRSERQKATVIIESDSYTTDILYRPDVTEARLGNRLLSHYLVTIDYKRRQVSLWKP